MRATWVPLLYFGEPKLAERMPGFEEQQFETIERNNLRRHEVTFKNHNRTIMKIYKESIRSMYL